MENRQFIIAMLMHTMEVDLEHELGEVRHLALCETDDQLLHLLADIVKDMRFLTGKYQDMLTRLQVSPDEVQ